jgi:hypothetical protein
MQKDVLNIDLSNKTPQEVAQFLSALLAAKRTLLTKHGLNIRLLPPKTRKVHLNTRPSEN